MARILVGVSGGIAAYKACELVRLLVRSGHEVVPLVTPGAERFVTAETFNALARRPAGDDPYLHLTRGDLFVVAPCTANTLAKLAYGIADNLLTQAALAHRGPVLVAPAMNPRMWANAATRANVDTLRDRGLEFIGPDEGEMAEGEWGVGRLAEPEEIAARALQLLGAPTLAGRRVLVTAGGTREPLDDVRYLGNRSSGRMGVALAEEARRRGADVTLLAAHPAVAPPAGVRVISTPTAADMAEAALQDLNYDIAICSAAVADYRPVEVIAGKRAKDAEGWSLELVPTTDIARALGGQKAEGQVLVTFGAEIGVEGLERKRTMLTSKNADVVVFNDVSVPGIGFDSSDNAVTIVTATGEHEIARASKSAIAAAVLDAAEALLR